MSSATPNSQQRAKLPGALLASKRLVLTVKGHLDTSGRCKEDAIEKDSVEEFDGLSASAAADSTMHFTHEDPLHLMAVLLLTSALQGCVFLYAAWCS